MKKQTVLFASLLLVFVFAISAAQAGWYCPVCGQENDDNFCPKDGTSRPNGDGGSFSAGDLLKLGRYEQNNKFTDGAEEIEWYILDVQGNKALLLSKYSLDQKPYETEHRETAWENSWIREWLNETFYHQAFTEDDQAIILESEVKNGADQSLYHVDGGNDTLDYIFLLSGKEYEQYVSDDEAEEGEKYEYGGCTYYACGLTEEDEYTYEAGYWLRSPGEDRSMASDIDWDGTPSCFEVNAEEVSVRPCMWIDLGKYAER